MENMTNEEMIKDYRRARFWSDDLTREIKSIAKDIYPTTPYWCDTGSDYNACMAMLKTFRNDLKDYKNRYKTNMLAAILGITFGVLLGMIIPLPAEKDIDIKIMKEEYLPIRNDYVFIHPTGTNDLIEVFVEKSNTWRVCKNGLSNCKEVRIDE